MAKKTNARAQFLKSLDSLNQQLQTLRTSRRNLRREVKDLNREADKLAHAADVIAADDAQFRAWHESDLSLQIVASGEPGFITVTCMMKTERNHLSFAKDFHIAHVCQCIPYMAPLTIDAWRDMLHMAVEILDKPRD